MAEERRWRQRHAHESNTTPYGTFGTASYHENGQHWTFLRNSLAEPNLVYQGDDTGNGNAPLLRIISDSTISTGPSAKLEASQRSTVDSTLYNRYPELAAASSTIHAISHAEIDIGSGGTAGTTLSFGQAVWLGIDGSISGNLTVPISAYVDGPDRSLLHIACLGRQSLHYTSEHGASSSLQLPSLIGDPTSSWNGLLPIEQVIFSRRDLDGRSGTFLAVRQASQTSIFEPFLHRDAFASVSSTDRSSLEPNRLLTLPRSRTGGMDHADVCFHPHDQRKLAVIDIEGNWSIWHIQGRRTRTTRVLYKIALQISNKIFSWEHKRRPQGIELYFDGWHRVLWVSTGGDDVNQLLVCNRQDAKLFDIMEANKHEVCSVDVRLDTRKVDAYILDVKPGPTPDICFILTTSRLLVFDFTKKEWKDKGATRGPALLFAWQHFLSTSNLSLKLATVELHEAILAALYSGDSTLVQLYLIRFMHVDGELCVTADLPSTFCLPANVTHGPIAHMALVTLETSHDKHHELEEEPSLVQIVIQHEDLSVSIVTTALPDQEGLQLDKRKLILKLPPNRNIHRKSQRFVDDMDDGDDLAGFIVDDEEVEQSHYTEDPLDTDQEILPDTRILNEPQDEASRALREVTVSKYSAVALAEVLRQATSAPSASRRDIPTALEAFEQNLQDSSSILHDAALAQLLSELFEKNARIEDIETDSATLERALHMIGTAVQDRLHISTVRKQHSQTLLQTYEVLFDSYVNSLNPAVPDLFRVQRERQVRDISLDLFLSSRAVRQLRASHVLPTPGTDALNPPDSDLMILSDPLMQPDPTSRQTPAQISASQPTPQPQSYGEPNPHPHQSPLDDAISRLSSYTAITKPPIQPTQDDFTSHIPSLLAHLPNSADANPSAYDYHATELKLAARDDSNREQAPKNKADRKAERLARARRRAEGINISRMEASGITQPRTLNTGKSEAQPLLAQPMSEGNMPSSSQVVAPMTSTQPVSGTFANRAKPKKKRKRVAGF